MGQKKQKKDEMITIKKSDLAEILLELNNVSANLDLYCEKPLKMVPQMALGQARLTVRELVRDLKKHF